MIVSIKYSYVGCKAYIDLPLSRTSYLAIVYYHIMFFDALSALIRWLTRSLLISTIAISCGTFLLLILYMQFVQSASPKRNFFEKLFSGF